MSRAGLYGLNLWFSRIRGINALRGYGRQMSKY